MVNERFCVDCRHFEDWLCMRLVANLVTGEKSPCAMEASTQRGQNGTGYCGREGLYWEAKETA